MKRPRVSIAGMMQAVAVVAVDVGLIRAAERAEWSWTVPLDLLAYALVPSLSLLVLTLAGIGAALVRHREASPFAVGYLLLGGLAAFLVGLGFLNQSWVIGLLGLFERALEVILSGSHPVPVLETIVGYLVILSALTGPQVVVGLIGGAVAARLGITLIVKGRASTEATRSIHFPKGPDVVG